MRLEITDEAIDAMSPAGRFAQEYYTDTKLQGFGLRVGKSRKSFFVERRVDGRTVRETIGRYGDVGATAAREIAKRRLASMQVPRALRSLAGLRELPLEVGSGIYFLCKGDEVVYVGQSIAAMRRCSQHSETKDFDRALFVPCAEKDLCEMEARFINELAPQLNGRSKNGKLIAPRSRPAQSETV